MDNIVKPNIIPYDEMMKLKTYPIEPVNMDIPNINIPLTMTVKKRETEAPNTISVNIRSLLNSLTSDNILQVKEKIREVIINKVQNIDMLNEIAHELLEQFIITEQHIKNYMQILNSIHAAKILIVDQTTNEKKLSDTIGNCFLKQCRILIMEKISEENILNLAKLNLDDYKQLLVYNKEKSKILNLIIVICCLYEQKTTTYVRINAEQIFSVMNKIFDIYKKLQTKMLNLGNPYEEECKDEEEYFICEKMCTIYAEQLYTFIYTCYDLFMNDQTLINSGFREYPISTQNTTTNFTMKDVILKFKLEIIPTLTEAFLISKCNELN